jgi:hypothetical protein
VLALGEYERLAAGGLDHVAERGLQERQDLADHRRLALVARVELPPWSRSSMSAPSHRRLCIVYSTTFSANTLGSRPCRATSPMREIASTPPWRRASSSVSPAG